jgi:hypothetical protein
MSYLKRREILDLHLTKKTAKSANDEEEEE